MTLPSKVKKGKKINQKGSSGAAIGGILKNQCTMAQCHVFWGLLKIIGIVL